MNFKGKILKIIANFYYVQDFTSNKICECFARGRLLKEGKLLIVGDTVEVEEASPSQGVIVDCYERKNKVIKPSIANVDQILIVFSTQDPDFDFYNLDRYLSFIKYELPNENIAICINKIDLKEININENYKNSGYNVFYISALKKLSLQEITNWCINNTTLIAGPSGVGKSSLIKALIPTSDVVIGDLSSIKTGKHITRNVQLVPIKTDSEQGFLVDTPGFTQISFAGLDSSMLLQTFKELINLNCNFNDCLHNGEEGCYLNESDSYKFISETRVESYRKILNELQSEVIYSTKEEEKVKSIGGNQNKHLPKIDQKSRAKSRKSKKQELSKLKKEFEN